MRRSENPKGGIRPGYEIENEKNRVELTKTLTPVSHSIIALSRAYHEYVPILISTLHSLVLLNGVDCILTEKRGQDKSCANLTDHHSDQYHVLPISKCDILGIIVHCHYKANGSIIMIIDDGTGFCDCISWIDDNDLDIHDDIYRQRYKVSDLVRISAVIKVLALNQKRVVNVCSVPYEGWTCSRELQVYSIELIPDRNLEAVHWLCCMQFRRRIGIEFPHELSGDDWWKMDSQQRIMQTPVLNGLETFQLLPKDERSRILTSRGTKDSFEHYGDDERLLMQYYGRDCRCRLTYKDSLLYCHCLATFEPLDPEYTFRDALLDKLLEMEARNGSDRNVLPAQPQNQMKVDGTRDGAKGGLEFNYATIYNDTRLQSIAKDVVSKTTHRQLNQRRLFTIAFKHLRNDGILYLENADEDVYLLISKARVLFPAILSIEVENDQRIYSHKTTGKPSNRNLVLPKFLQNGTISSAKLRIVKRLVATHRQLS